MVQSYQQQYARILRDLIYNPQKIGDSRVGKIRSRFLEVIRVDLQKEFPLMDIKKVSFDNILFELLWFVNGNTNVKKLTEKGCKIWNDDAYRYYKEKYSKFHDENKIEKNLESPFFLSKKDFMKNILDEKSLKIPLLGGGYNTYYFGDLDKIYGQQWRNFNGKTDQLQNCIDKLFSNPDDRRIIVTAHNPTDLEEGNVGLPACHNMFQFYTIPLLIEERSKIAKYEYGLEIFDENQLNELNIPKRLISLWFNLRSNDFFLGQPYNIASYALLLMMIAKITNMIPKEVVCTAVDCHLYEKHLEPSYEWLNRYDNLFYNENNIDMMKEAKFTFSKSKVKITKKDNIDDFVFEDFKLINYNPSSQIKAELLT